MAEVPPIPEPRPGPSEPPLPPTFEHSGAAIDGGPGARRGGSKQVVAIILGLALVGGAATGVFLAGRSTKRDAKRPISTVIPAGWTTYTKSADGFRLGLPQGWDDIEPGEVDNALKGLREENAELADLIGQQVEGSLSDVIRFFALDGESPTLEQGFATNVSVVVEPDLPGGLEFATYINANLAQLRKVPGVDITEEDREVALAGGKAALIKSHLTLNTPAGAQVVAVTQYIWLDGDRGLILSMTTTPEHEATYASLFEQIANTFQAL
ncbi:MAG: hypothetical protein ACRDKS_16080 [Actinomycetota bacterium]